MSKKSTFKIIGLSSVLVTALLGACRSNDLGSQKPDKINVNVSLATWDGGAGVVIARKCANCHTAQRSSFVPDNTPHELDGIESIEFFRNPANRGYAKMMRKRIESADATRQMPPKFATPLYDDEKAVVLEFLKSVEEGKFAAQPCVKPLALKEFTRFARGGDDDDDDDDDDDNGHHEPGDDDHHGPATPQPGQGGGTGDGASSPCAPAQPAEPANPPAKVTFNDVAAIVMANCAGCHNGTSNFSLRTREDFVAKRPFPLNEIQSGSMPLGNSGFKDSPDGRLLIQWLQGPQTE